MAPKDQRLLPVYEALSAGRLKVLSVDIFDTLLWRRVPEPSDVFLLLGQKLQRADQLAAHISPVAFAELRRAAQTAARERAFVATKSREVTLEDIYAELPDAIFAPNFSSPERVSVELACERHLMILDDGVVALMKHAKDAGARVVLVSDTYFTSEHLNEFLQAAGFRDQGSVDRLFVSCEIGRPKFLDLFDFVLKELAVQAGELVHVGDNPDADVHPCEARGIPSVHYDKWSFSPRAQDKEYPADRLSRLPLFGEDGDRGLTGLRSRLYHRVPEDIDTELHFYWRYGSSVLAPVFTNFARWIVESCTSENTTRIFGIMREGRFLGRVVEATAEKLGVKLEVEELWLSRRAVIRAALYDDDLTLLPEAISLSPGTTKDEVLSGLGLEIAEVDAVFSAPFEWSGSNAIPALTQAIVQTPALREKVLERSSILRRNLLKGLGKQIDLSQPRSVCVVDLGYAATIQTVLKKIFDREGVQAKLYGLYLALNAKAAINIAAGTDIRAYLDHEGIDGQVGALLSRTPDVLEHACMCREGSLSEYDSDGAPSLLPNQREEAQLLQMETLQRGILDGLGHVNDLLGDVNAAPTDNVAMKKQISEIIKSSLLYPTRGEAETIGAWIHEANFDLADRRRLSDMAIDLGALEYQGWSVLQAMGRGQCYWPAAALALVNPFVADAFAAGADAGYGADHLTSGPMLGGMAICPDVGVGFESKLGGTVPLAVNAFGRGEISVALKSLGPQVYQRLRLQFPKAAALLAIDQISLIYVGQRNQKTVVLNAGADLERLAWSNIQSGPEGLVAAGKEGAEAIIDLQADTPTWLHGLHLRLRYRYLRTDELFG